MGVRKAARTSNNTTQAAQKVIRLLNCFTSSAATSLGVTELSAMTGWTSSSVSRLLRELEQVNAIGYALTVEELAIGLTVIAAPLRDFTGAVVAAITIGGPSFRIMGRHLEDCITLIKAEAAAIAGELGGRMSSLAPV